MVVRIDIMTILISMMTMMRMRMWKRVMNCGRVMTPAVFMMVMIRWKGGGRGGTHCYCCSIDYKLSSQSFRVINGTGPQSLSALLTIYTPSRQLRSASNTSLFRIPSFKTKTNGQWYFSRQAAYVWNNSPQSVRHSTPISSFKTPLLSPPSSLKTHLLYK